MLLLLMLLLVAEFHWKLYSHENFQGSTSHFFTFIFINGLRKISKPLQSSEFFSM